MTKKKLTPAQEAIRKAHNKLIADCSRKPAPVRRQVEPEAPMTPAQRDPRAVQCPSPAFYHRVGVEQAAPVFSSMRPGQYHPGDTWAKKFVEGEAA